jgi:hypothetical protein
VASSSSTRFGSEILTIKDSGIPSRSIFYHLLYLNRELGQSRPHRVQATGWRVRGSNPGGSTKDSSPKSPRTASCPGAYPAPCWMAIRVKQEGRDVQQTPSYAEVKNEWRYSSTPIHAFISKHGKLHLYLLLVTLRCKKLSWAYFIVLREQHCWEYPNLSEVILVLSRVTMSYGTSMNYCVSPSNWQGNVGQKHHWLLYSFFWVIPRRLNFMCRRFRALFQLHRRCSESGSFGDVHETLLTIKKNQLCKKYYTTEGANIVITRRRYK